MQITNGPRSAKSIRNRIYTQNLKFAAGQRRMVAWVGAVHYYQLINLNTGYPVAEDVVEMSGSEAVKLNDVLRIRYSDDVSAEIAIGVGFGKTKSVMKRWKICQQLALAV